MRLSASLLLFASLFVGTASPTFGQVGYEDALPGLTFVRPVDLQQAGDGAGRLFVVEQPGRVYVVPDPQAPSRALFLDLTDRVRFGGEQGLLGLAFHPEFAENGLFYVNYTASNPRRTVVSRFRVRADDPDAADPGSELVLLTVEQPFGNHNGGQLAFGPDSLLYIALGDGGSANDPRGHGQNRRTLLGALLRIDVDRTDPGLRYAIPPDNPFAGNTEGFREEIYAYGLRNPWRFSFDPLTGALWLADVGQNDYEEINLIRRGGNYGWNLREGTHCFPIGTACGATPTALPVWEYAHGGGRRSVTGGVVYRGDRAPELRGRYLYADYEIGAVWSLGYTPDSALVNSELFRTPLAVSTFGVDASGEALFAAFDGRVYRFTSATTAGEEGQTPPEAFALEPPYPNPASGNTVLRFRVDRAGPVRLSVVDLLGRTRALAFDGPASAGRHEVAFDGAGLPAGVYLIRLDVADRTRTRRLVLAR